MSTTHKKERRKRRCRPGTVAKREIRKLQRLDAPELLSPKAPAERFIRLISSKIGDYRFTPQAIYALRLAMEQETVLLAMSANRMASHAGRITIMPKDFNAVSDVRQIYPSGGGGGVSNSSKHTANPVSTKSRTRSKLPDDAQSV